MKKLLLRRQFRAHKTIWDEVIHRVISFAWSSFSMVLLLFRKICTRFPVLLLCHITYNSLPLLLLLSLFFCFHSCRWQRYYSMRQKFDIPCFQHTFIYPHTQTFAPTSSFTHIHGTHAHSKSSHSLVCIYFVFQWDEKKFCFWILCDQLPPFRNRMEKRRGTWNYINKFQLKYQFVTAVLHSTKVTSM